MDRYLKHKAYCGINMGYTDPRDFMTYLKANGATQKEAQHLLLYYMDLGYING